MESSTQSKIDTRKILQEKGKDQSKDVYYIPGYMRIKVKNFTEMNLDSLSAKMNATLIFTIYYGLIPDEVVLELQKSIILLFGRDDAIKLTDKGDGNQKKLETKVKRDKSKREIRFTIRKIFQLRIESEIFWSPFEIINLILSVTVQPVVTAKGTVKVNLLDNYGQNWIKISYTNEGSFGNYELAQSLMKANYSNDRVCQFQDMKNTHKEQLQKYKEKFIQKKVKLFGSEKGQNTQKPQSKNSKTPEKQLNQKKSEEGKNESNQNTQKKKEQPKFEHFQYAHFNVPLYKYPMVAVATIFFPLWLLAIINLGIFYQNQSLAERIASISALMIAFVALIPTIRDQIPPNPQVIFIEYLVYAQTFTSLLALIDSLSVIDKENYNLDWTTNGLFLVSCIITVITFISIIVMLILHYCKWQPNYNRKIMDEKDVQFNKSNWKNDMCDEYFNAINNLRTKKLIAFR